MNNELLQEDIDQLLAQPNKKERAKRLYQKFVDNDKKFSEEIVCSLVRKLLDDEEKGQGVWLGGEACWSLVELKDHEAKTLETGYHEITAGCALEYESSHIIYDDDNYEPLQRDAAIKLQLKPKFEIKDWEFNWQ